MNWIRGFSDQESDTQPMRNVEDAPQEMRQELVDLFFYRVGTEPWHHIPGTCLSSNLPKPRRES
jgi:hypothetical protein